MSRVFSIILFFSDFFPVVDVCCSKTIIEPIPAGACDFIILDLENFR